MGILGDILKYLANSITDKAVEMQRSNPEFKKYVSKYYSLSKDELLQEMKQVNNPTAKAALAYLVRKK